MIRPPSSPSSKGLGLGLGLDSGSSYQREQSSVSRAPPSPSLSFTFSPPPPDNPSKSGNSQGQGNNADAYFYALKVAHIDEILTRARSQPQNSPRPASVNSFSSNGTSYDKRQSSSTSHHAPSSPPLNVGKEKAFKPAKLPKEFWKQLVQFLAADLTKISASGSAMGMEGKAFLSVASGFFTMIEEKKSLRKERMWKEVIEAFTLSAHQSLAPFPRGPATEFRVHKQRFLIICTNVLRSLLDGRDEEDVERMGRLEREMYAEPSIDLGSPPPAPEKKKLFSRSPVPAQIDLSGAVENFPPNKLKETTGRLFNIHPSRLEQDWIAIKQSPHYNMTAWQNDLKILLSKCARQQPSSARAEEFMNLQTEIEELNRLFPSLHTTPIQGAIPLSPALSDRSRRSSTRSNSSSIDRSPRIISGPTFSVAGKLSPDMRAGEDFFHNAQSPASPPMSHFNRELSIIPPASSVKSVYRLLIDQSLVCQSHPEVQELIRKCEEFWRLDTETKLVVTLVSAVNGWDEGRKGGGEAMEASLRELSSIRWDWSRADDENRSSLAASLLQLLSTLRTIFADYLRDLSTSATPPQPSRSLTLLPIVTSLPFLPQIGIDITSEFKEIAAQLHTLAVETYCLQVVEFLSANGDAEVKGFEGLAGWIETSTKNTMSAFPRPIAGINIAGALLSKQLPIFYAEMSVLDKPKSGGKTVEDIFPLYTIVGRLHQLWSQVCPDVESQFDINSFFEPHVISWLENTDEIETSKWVNRAVAFDNWTPDGPGLCSSSVIDLFQFIRESVAIVLSDLPLAEYPRAVYTVDLAKSTSSALNQYSQLLQTLFDMELSTSVPGGPQDSIPAVTNGKASAWLAKGKQAANKAIAAASSKGKQGYVISSQTCVKINDIGAARASLQDLRETMRPEECAETIRRNKLNRKIETEDSQGHDFIVKIVRGEDLFSKSLTKPADGLVIVTEVESGKRALKTRTILDTVTPRWDETFEANVTTPVTYDLSAFDRYLVGKHDLIGKSTFTLNPKRFTDNQTHNVWITLSPRGRVLIRVTMVGSQHSVSHHLERARRNLDQAEEEMIRRLVEKMSEVSKSVISRSAINTLMKNAAKGKRTPGQVRPTDEDVDASLLPLTGYLDQSLATFNNSFAENLKEEVMLQLWKSLLDIILGVMCPPLSDKESSMEPLTPLEIDVMFKYVKILKAFLNASEDGIEHGVSLRKLENSQYRDLLLFAKFNDLNTQLLREKASAAVKGAVRSIPTKAGMASLNSKSSGLSAMAGGEESDEQQAEVLLRILMMRPGTSEFLAHQNEVLNKARRSVAATFL